MIGIERIARLFKVAEAYKPSDDVFPIGIEIFDNAMDGGVRDGELIVVSGPTGQGKTTFLQNLTINLDKIKVPTLWFTYEMSPWYLKEKFVTMGQTKKLLTYAPTDDLYMKMSWMEDMIKEAKNDHLCKIVFIDHLHYLLPLLAGTNSSLMIGSIVRELKRLAVKTETIIFLIAHTKKIYQDEDLDLSSVRDSSLVVQEADFVFLVERLKKEKRRGSGIKKEGTLWTDNSRVQLAKNRRTGLMVYKVFTVIKNIFHEKKDEGIIEALSHNEESEEF